MNVKPVTLPGSPTPYEYALLSRAAYYDDIATFRDTERPLYKYLKHKGWQLKDTIKQTSGYRGSIWVNPHRKQLVIAHRGSENGDSWITDIESVVKKQPGDFIDAAIATLSHDDVLAYQQDGFRVSTTGHSLGGFLAQACVYWSKRQTVQPVVASSPSSSSSVQASTSTASTLRVATDVNAVVFDSPGALDFLKTFHSNLGSRDKVDLKALDVQTFCPMPTLVNTFGKHIGTVWHLGGVETMRFAFAMAHKMESFLGLFDPETGQAREQIQMTDWPQADYRDFSSLTGAASKGVRTLLKAPLAFVNWLYKGVKRSADDTWYDRVFRTPDSEVSKALTQADMDIDTVEQAIDLAIRGHYSKLDLEASKHQLALSHFEPILQHFLEDLAQAQTLEFNRIGWHEMITKIYGADARFLLDISIIKHNKRSVVVIPEAYTGNAFEFQARLRDIVNNNGVVSFIDFMHEYMGDMSSRVLLLENERKTITKGSIVADLLTNEIQNLSQKIQELEERVNKHNPHGIQQVSEEKPHVFLHLGALADKKGSTAIAENRGITAEDIVKVASSIPSDLFKNPSGRILAGVASAFATEEGGNAHVISTFGPTSSTLLAAPAPSQRREKPHASKPSSVAPLTISGEILAPPKKPGARQ